MRGGRRLRGNMDFTLQTNFTHGRLGGDDLTFFYYDIGEDHLQGWPSSYDWESVVLKYKGVLNIKDCNKDDIPNEFIENNIHFTVSNSSQVDNGNVASAFFRHLRNAFSHYRIVSRKDWYEFTDFNNKGHITMRGCVKAALLKEFCYHFFDQRESLINSTDT